MLHRLLYDDGHSWDRALLCPSSQFRGRFLFARFDPRDTLSMLARGTAQHQWPSERSTARSCTYSIIVCGVGRQARGHSEIAGTSFDEREAYYQYSRANWS
jgi:hypothetical protein